mmetsp:Transcript_17462/g.24485  ORF Transcript_17462/g.24485 Transcript_17462/m.24485 type:complete len:504 (-) Transcript_17462:86-1597(-)
MSATGPAHIISYDGHTLMSTFAASALARLSQKSGPPVTPEKTAKSAELETDIAAVVKPPPPNCVASDDQKVAVSYPPIKVAETIAREKTTETTSGGKISNEIGIGVSTNTDGSVPPPTAVMLFESPSTSSSVTSFQNTTNYLLHDYPTSPPQYWSVMRPVRYSAMAGDALPVWVAQTPVTPLLEHWSRSIPIFKKPNYLTSDLVAHVEANPGTKVLAYLPLEQLPSANHAVPPKVHYHLAGKAAIPSISPRSPALYPSTSAAFRPCVVKVTHAMGSLGIFVIKTDEDERKMAEFLEATGRPDYISSEFVDIQRNLACHFFVDPSGEVTWFGYSENMKLEFAPHWSSDSTFCIDKQDEMRELLAPYALDTANYMLSLGYWGFAGIDVLFDRSGKGYIVDVNPRVTGSMPALVATPGIHEKYGFTVGKFRKSTKWSYPGTKEELLAKADLWNAENQKKGHVVLFSVHEKKEKCTQLNIAVWAFSEKDAQEIFDVFCQDGGEGGRA